MQSGARPFVCSSALTKVLTHTNCALAKNSQLSGHLVANASPGAGGLATGAAPAAHAAGASDASVSRQPVAKICKHPHGICINAI